MPLSELKLPKVSDHGAELAVLATIGIGVLVLIGIVLGETAHLNLKAALVDTSPFLLIEQAIISAIKDRWTARNADAAGARSSALLAAAPPLSDKIDQAQ